MLRTLAPVLALLLLAYVPDAAAQSPPSVSRIKADAREHLQPNATVTIRGNGLREWNRGAWEYRRSITMRKPVADMRGVEVEIYGDIVYQSSGGGYQYRGFNVSDSRYFGLAPPSPAEVRALLATDPVRLYPGNALGDGRSFELVAGHEPEWLTPQSVVLRVRMRYLEKVSSTVVADNEALRDVQLFREDVGGPWTEFYPPTTRETTEIARQTYTEEAVDRMPRLFDVAQAEQAEAAAAALPQLDVPEFTDSVEFWRYTYKMLRESDGPTLRAYLGAVLGPQFYHDGSTTALNHFGQALVDEVVDEATAHETTYGDMHCAEPSIDWERTNATRGQRLYLRSIVDTPPRGAGNSWSTEITMTQTNEGYRNGQPVPGALRINSLSITLRRDADNVAWLNSFDDRSQLCPDDGRAGSARADTPAQGAVETGRRILGSIFGRRD